MAMNLENLVETRNPTAAEILQQLNELINDDADDYNQLADAYKGLEDHCEEQTARIAGLMLQTDQLQAQVDALREGNKLLMGERNEVAAERNKAVKAFDVTLAKSVSLAAKVKELEAKLKTITQHGDPKKLIAANKTLRERNVELMQQNDKFKLRAIEATKEMEAVITRAGAAATLPSYSKGGENIYIHPEPLSMERDGKVMKLIALTFWTTIGIGRVVTWDNEKDQPHFASVNHKTVDAKLRPSQEALDWVVDWFRAHVITVGNVQQIKTKYQVKVGSKK